MKHPQNMMYAYTHSEGAPDPFKVIADLRERAYAAAEIAERYMRIADRDESRANAKINISYAHSAATLSLALSKLAES